MKQILEILKAQMNGTEKDMEDRPSKILKMESGSHNRKNIEGKAKSKRINRYLCENKKNLSHP